MLVFLDLIFCVKYVGSIDSCNNNRIIAGGSDVKLVTKFSILGEFNQINKLLSRWRHWHCYAVVIINFERISQIFLVFLFLILNR